MIDEDIFLKMLMNFIVKGFKFEIVEKYWIRKLLMIYFEFLRELS